MGPAFSELSPAARGLWAKSGQPHGHGLLCHMLDVAAVAEALLNREPRQTVALAARWFGLRDEVAVRWLATMAGLHDFGKAMPGFQHKWPIGKTVDAEHGLPFNIAALQVKRHCHATCALLRRTTKQEFSRCSWLGPVALALGGHHGYVPRSTEIRNGHPRNEGNEWLQVREEILNAYWSTLQPGACPSEGELSLAACAWFAGLTSVADWIGSNQDWFPPGQRSQTLAGHYREALELAIGALEKLGWPAFRELLAERIGIHELLGRILRKATVQARPLQQVGDKLLNQVEGPSLMIVEAPMGEGKTELAFLAHLRLQSRNGHRGLYIALPTQATGNAMFTRTLSFLRVFTDGLPLDIQLVHSGAAQTEDTLRLLSVDDSKEETVASAAWFSQRKRPLLSPYGVGTIDQVLFATLNVKHHFVRLWGLANRVVVLDEVHAYDTYTSTLIEALLRWLKRMDCSVVLMSATLPAARRNDFLRAWGGGAVSDVAYPRIVVTAGQLSKGEHVHCRSLAPIAVASISEDISTIGDAAVRSVSQGGCGAIIVNTVQRAQDLYTALRQRVDAETKLFLFHARYPLDERTLREKAVLECFGHSDSDKRPARALLVATQVVEQSLDLDFDFMFSDLAPIDLLFQRAGRLHRHNRERPAAHRQPCLTVAGFQRDREPELKETAWGFVYDPYILYRTWAIAGKEPVWQLPGDIDRLVQAVYGGTPYEEQERVAFERKLDTALGEHLAIVAEQRQHAIDVAIDAEAEPQNAYNNKPRASDEDDGAAPKVVTRLGAESVTVVPVHTEEGLWRLFPGEEPFDPESLLDDALARRIYRRQVRLSRKDIVVALRERKAPGGFADNPLLRSLKPLCLNHCLADFGRLRVRLDAEIGLTYESTENP